MHFILVILQHLALPTVVGGARKGLGKRHCLVSISSSLGSALSSLMMPRPPPRPHPPCVLWARPGVHPLHVMRVVMVKGWAEEKPLWWTKWRGRGEGNKETDAAAMMVACLPHSLTFPPLPHNPQDFRRDRPCKSSVGFPFLSWVSSSVTSTPLPIEATASQEQVC